MRSLRARVTLTTVLVAAVGLTVGVWGFTLATERALRSQLDRDLTAEGEAIARRVGDGAAPGALVAATPATRLVQVRRPDGTVLAGSGHAIRQSADLARLEIHSDPRTPPSGAGWVTGRGDIGSLGPGWRVATVAGQGPSGRLDVVVAAPLADLDHTVRTVSGVAYASAPLLVAVIGALVWSALGRLLQPVEHLRRQAAEAVDVYPPPRLAAARSGAEIQALMATLDTLLQRSAAGIRRQRRFLANAAHELLSPLAVLRTVLQVAQRRNDPSEMPKVLERSLETQERLEQIAQQLLSLARAEQADRISMTDVDLAALVRDVAGELAPDGGVPVVPHVPGTLVVAGDPVGLRQVVDNLAHNARRHASARVELHLRATGDLAVLDVDDDGPGVASEHRRVVFEPFARLEADRARHQRGAGLGLAITRAVAVRHGGDVAVSDSPLGGARFRVVLPRRATAIPAAGAPIFEAGG